MLGKLSVLKYYSLSDIFILILIILIQTLKKEYKNKEIKQQFQFKKTIFLHQLYLCQRMTDNEKLKRKIIMTFSM